MGVDHEIEVINDGIAQVYRVLYKINYQLSGTLISLNGSLNKVDEVVNDGVVAVAKIENDILNVTNKFPLEVTYMCILILFVILFNVLSVYLLYCVYKQYVEMSYQSDKIVRNYMKKVYNAIPRRDSLEHIETPPPTYDEYVKTADLYVEYHRNGSVSTSVLPNQPSI